jgi:hypothetical protein
MVFEDESITDAFYEYTANYSKPLKTGKKGRSSQHLWCVLYILRHVLALGKNQT